MAGAYVLPFEKPVVELARRVRELGERARGDERLVPELARLEKKTERLTREIFRELSPMQKVMVARHPERPFALDYVSRLFGDFVELHGDRREADDPAIVGGLATFRGRSVVVVAHQKGRGTKENVARRFGMPQPEGYRKALRLYALADRHALPIVTLVDTPGAYPGLEAEERGQSEAIGAALLELSRVRVPVVATILGEGGSGGALALALANRVLCLELAYYSVISPEGCAAILWKDASRASEAADALALTAPELLRLGVVDAVVDEPLGGAHRDHDAAARFVGDAIAAALLTLADLGPDELAEQRRARFRALGEFSG